MKNNINKLIALALCSTFLAGVAAVTADDQKTGDQFCKQELAALEQFLRLSDEQLDRIQEVLSRVRAMPADERRVQANEIVRFRSLPTEERIRIREGWGWQSTQDRDDWRQMMQGLSPGERQQIHDRMQNVDPGERNAIRLEILEHWRDQR